MLNDVRAATPVTKWLEIVRFELVHQLRRWPLWVLFGLFMFPLVGVTLDQLAAAGGAGMPFNAPLGVAQSGAVMGLVATLILAAVVGDAATRDVTTRLEPLMQAAPIGRAAYLGGRWFGAFLVAAGVMSAVPAVRILVALSRPDLAGELGPFRAAAYLQTYLLVLLPNALIATAVMFALATFVRHSLGSWLGAALLFIGGQGSHAYLGDILGRWDLATLFDATGITALDLMGQTWTPVDVGARMIATESMLLWNRVFWLAIAASVLAFTYRHFNFAARTGAPRWWQRLRSSRRRRPSVATPVPLGPPLSVPSAPREFGPARRAHQTLSVLRDSLREIAPPWTWPIIPLVAAAQYALTTGALGSMGAGTPVLPTTNLVLRTLGPGVGDAPPPVVLAIILLPILLAGELIWRERDANIQALADSTPVPDGVRFVGKLLGLWLVIVALLLAMALGGVLAQASIGGALVEPLVYLQVVGLGLVRPLLFALFALSVHVLVNHKHIGHVVVLLLVAPVMPQLLGVEHPLLFLGSEPAWQHSSISGFGPYLGPLLWFDLYWVAWAVLLALIARLFWVRGAEQDAGERLRIARMRGLRTRTSIGAAIVAVLLVGGIVFYNTNVLNTYRTSAEIVAQRADYERLYARFRDAPQPRLKSTDLIVELYPDRAEADVRGVHVLVNQTEVPIDTLHVATSVVVETVTLEFDRPAVLAGALGLPDDALGHRMYVLSEPLAPGDTLRMTWEVRHAPRGFPARDLSTAVVGNGSFIPAADWMPLIGYQLGRQLTSAVDRRASGLPVWSPTPSLEDAEAALDRYGMDQLRLTATIGTSEDQIGVAAGALVRTWTDGGRRYSRYETNAPIGNGYAIFSADYTVSRDAWNDVAIEVFHHPDHDANVPRMLRGMNASLEQLTERFGPFPYDVIRMVEYPSAGGSLHAASATIWYQEMFSFFDVERDTRGFDMVFAVTAHEVAHQFQPVPARMEGRALLSESFAWYAAMGVVEAEYDTAHLERFLDFMRRSYLTPRSRAGVPLLRANDAFLGYRKGPFAMYALREYLGQDRVDLAWRRLRERHASHEPPFATSLDLYRELRAVTPDSLQTLLGDLIERNTHWELTTQRATAEPMPTGEWRVSLVVDARKVAVDTLGAETEMPMNDLIEIGVYAPASDRGAEPPLYLAMHRVRSGPQTITVIVPERPARAGIDPRHLLIDVRPDDNVIEMAGGPDALDQPSERN